MKSIANMKKIFFLILSLALFQVAQSQIDRSKMPEPGPAPKIEIGDYQSFTLKNGIRVFVVENHKLPRVTFNLIIDRDPILEGEKAGYVSLAGSMLREGTTNRSKEELDEEIDFIGGQLSTSSTSVYASSLSEYSEKMMELMADVILHPAFEETSFEKLKKQSISGLQFGKNDPNTISQRVFNVLLYGKDHPYGEIETESTVENITLDDCKNYYQTYFKPNISYLAIVGDINMKEAKKLVNKYLGKWEDGEVPSAEFEDPENPEIIHIAMVNRDNAVQSVISIGNLTELPPGSPDVIPLRIANQILGGGSMGRLFQNLREDKAYTYGAYSYYDTDKLIGSFRAGASVRNEVTDSAVTEFYVELDRIRDEKISDEELRNAKNYITGSFARSLERPQTIANFAINTARYHLPEDYYTNYLKRVEAVSSTEVQSAARSHIDPGHSTLLIVGKADEVASKLEKFGPVHYYDTEGNPIEAPSSKKADKSGEEIIRDYIEALGGEALLQDIIDMSITMEGTIQGQPLTMIRKMRQPNKGAVVLKMSMGGQEMEIMNMKFDGSHYVRIMQGQEIPATEEDVEEAKLDFAMFPERLYLSEEGFTVEATSIKNINGEDAYEVKVTFPNGKEVTEYYSVESGLKLRESSTQEGRNGESMVLNQDFSDYRQVEGLMFPHRVSLPLGPMNVELNVTEVLINTGLNDSDFSK